MQKEIGEKEKGGNNSKDRNRQKMKKEELKKVINTKIEGILIEMRREMAETERMKGKKTALGKRIATRREEVLEKEIDREMIIQGTKKREDARVSSTIFMRNVSGSIRKRDAAKGTESIEAEAAAPLAHDQIPPPHHHLRATIEDVISCPTGRSNCRKSPDTILRTNSTEEEIRKQ